MPPANAVEDLNVLRVDQVGSLVVPAELVAASDRRLRDEISEGELRDCGVPGNEGSFVSGEFLCTNILLRDSRTDQHLTHAGAEIDQVAMCHRHALGDAGRA